jgi:hypothetical protein
MALERALMPRRKEVIYRHNVIFLPSIFPMRESRARGGVDPDGEALVSCHFPQVPGVQREEETSFEERKDNDPLPPYQDHVIGYTLVPPPDETAFTCSEKPQDWPQQPFHSSFGPNSREGSSSFAQAQRTTKTITQNRK